LKPGGRYVTVGGYVHRILEVFLIGSLINLVSKKTIKLLPLKPNKGLHHVNKLFEEGKIKCIIDGPYSLDELPQKLQYFGEGKHAGKVVISM
jgi:NADPH:quinone reductase-like Zn-dependent oxidoreductase